MTEELNEETSGLSRRSMIKRGALVGGTLVWAQPVVQGFGTAAGAQTGVSPLTGFSYIAVVFTCNGNTFYAKYELDEGVWEDDPGALPGCEGELNTSGAAPVGGATADEMLHVSQSGSTVTISLEEFCTTGSFSDGVLKQGQDPCKDGNASGRTITFTDVETED